MIFSVDLDTCHEHECLSIITVSEGRQLFEITELSRYDFSDGRRLVLGIHGAFTLTLYDKMDDPFVIDLCHRLDSLEKSMEIIIKNIERAERLEKNNRDSQ